MNEPQVYAVRTISGCFGISLNVLDTIRGLSIKYPKNAVKILAACKEKLTEPGTDCVHLYFRERPDYEHTIMVERDESLETLKAKLKEMRARGFFKVIGHGS